MFIQPGRSDPRRALSSLAQHHTTDKRTRGRQLQRIRAEHAKLHPLCVGCLRKGTVREWTQLDHITPLCRGGKDAPSNRQGLCDECHDAKTRTDMGYRQPQRFEASGRPQGWGGVS